MIVTTVAPGPAVAALPARRWLAVPAGFALGLVLGLIARLWMRVIADDPDFSWSGTIFIVAAFALFGTGQGLSWAARHSGWRRAGVTGARVGGAVLTLPLFTGAGAIMLPTVLTASLAVWRRDWPRWIRVLTGLLALPVVILVVTGIAGEFGWALQTFVGNAAFVAIYAVVVAALQPTVAPLADGWRLARRGRVLLAVGGVLLLGLVAASLLGV